MNFTKSYTRKGWIWILCTVGCGICTPLWANEKPALKAKECKGTLAFYMGIYQNMQLGKLEQPTLLKGNARWGWTPSAMLGLKAQWGIWSAFADFALNHHTQILETQSFTLENGPSFSAMQVKQVHQTVRYRLGGACKLWGSNGWQLEMQGGIQAPMGMTGSHIKKTEISGNEQYRINKVREAHLHKWVQPFMGCEIKRRWAQNTWSLWVQYAWGGQKEILAQEVRMVKNADLTTYGVREKWNGAHFSVGAVCYWNGPSN